MKNLLLLFCFVLGVAYANGQNLVNNPSFEQYSSCPTNAGQVFKCINWSSYGHTPDYYNACNTNSTMDVPSNILGYQNAATGNAYCGLYHHGPTFNPREYIGSQLLQSLIIGSKYYVSIKVSLADNAQFYCPSNNMGVKFSTTPFDSLYIPQLNNNAQIYSNSIISDSSGWTQINGSFISDSNYIFIIVGNFFSDSATQYNCNLILTSSYYYIDDICVSLDSNTCYSSSTESLQTYNKENNEIKISIIDDNIILTNPFPHSIQINIRITDILGRELFAKQMYINETDKIPIELLSSSIYLITIQTKDTYQTIKFIKK